MLQREKQDFYFIIETNRGQIVMNYREMKFIFILKAIILSFDKHESNIFLIRQRLS